MDPFMNLVEMIKNQASGFCIERDGKKISLTQNELEQAVFYHYDQLGQNALDQASFKTGKAVTNEQREQLLEEITKNLTFMVQDKILEIAENVFNN